MTYTEKYSLQRLTALWAFSEAALGGLVHALHIPFSGVVLTGFAVVFISLIAKSSDNKNDILKSLAIVISVKFAVSPHTPFGAYVSVFLQGISGYIIFSFIRNYFASSMTLSIVSMLISSFQKVIVYTILFGYQIVDSINMFMKIATERLPLLKDLPEGFNFTFVIVGTYLSIYFISGIFLGIIVAKLPKWLQTAYQSDQYKSSLKLIDNETEVIDVPKQKRKKKRLLTVSIFIILILLLIISYLFPQYEKLESTKLILMFTRAILILMIWYFVILPFFVKLLQSKLSKSKKKYANEIDEIINMFPFLKRIFYLGWKSYEGSNIIKRIKYFLVFFILAFLTKE